MAEIDGGQPDMTSENAMRTEHRASEQPPDLAAQPRPPASEEEALTYLFHRRSLPRDRLAVVVAAVHDPSSSAHSLAGLLCEPLDDPAPRRGWLERIQASSPLPASVALADMDSIFDMSQASVLPSDSERPRQPAP